MGAQPIDDEATQPWILAVPQQRPYVLGVTEPDQGYCRRAWRSANSSFFSSETTGRCQTETVDSD